MKYSIIVTTHNRIIDLIECIQAIKTHTTDYELIVVDNGSTDGSVAYLKNIEDKQVHCIMNPDNTTFAKSNNQALRLVSKDTEYVIFLNNDTVVTADWVDRMEKYFSQIKNTGAVGPVTNMSNGVQGVGMKNPEQWHEENKNKYIITSILYGWCLMVKKTVLDEIGNFDETFINSYEDNDLCLRINLAGYKTVIAYDCWICHKGQSTIKMKYTMDEYYNNGQKNRDYYYNKHYTDRAQKLVAVMRLGHGCEPYIEQVIRQTEKIADVGIIVHLCRASDWLKRFIKDQKSVIKVIEYEGVFQEDYERNTLLQEALKTDADWCISVDGDEVYEDKFIDNVQKMMRPRNPEIMAYSCNWRTIWKQENGKEYYRTDSTFGNFINYRFFKLLPNMEITSSHPEGHHCGSAPLIPAEFIRTSNIRVKHLGYDTPEQRQKKFEFYQKNDHFKNRNDIGNDDYSHLIDKDIKVQEYCADNGVSCCMMIKNEERYIHDFLEKLDTIVDEFVIVDTGSTDKTLDIIRKFATTSLTKINIFEYKWDGNFSRPRNFAKSKATQKWILYLDADERIKHHDLIKMFKLTECNEFDGFIFNVKNLLSLVPVNGEVPYLSTRTVRLFRNIPELFFTGIIHETIDDALSALRNKRKVLIGSAPFYLLHYGYLRPKPELKKKFKYYEQLNNDQIKVTDDTDPRPHYNLSLHYFEDDMQTEGIKALQKALAINPMFYHANIQMASLNLTNATGFLTKVIKKLDDGHPFKKQAIKVVNFLNQNQFGHKKVCN